MPSEPAFRKVEVKNLPTQLKEPLTVRMIIRLCRRNGASGYTTPYLSQIISPWNDTEWCRAPTDQQKYQSAGCRRKWQLAQFFIRKNFERLDNPKWRGDSMGQATSKPPWEYICKKNKGGTKRTGSTKQYRFDREMLDEWQQVVVPSGPADIRLATLHLYQRKWESKRVVRKLINFL